MRIDSAITLTLGWVAAAAKIHNGIASFYGGNLAGGNCMLSSYKLPPGVSGTALAGSSWANAAMCGACLKVKGPNGSMKVMVVDKCPECGPNQLDVFENSFSKIGNPIKGTVPITWSVVPCGVTKPIVVRNKTGTSKYWFSMQVVNSNNPVTALDVSTDGGRTWHKTKRQDYNYFEKPGGGGFGVDPMTVRLTCSTGKKVTLTKVGSAASASYTAHGNC